MKLKVSTILILILILTGCKVHYGFKDGMSKYDSTKKILITQYENNSGNGPPDIATIFTEKTKDFYLQNGDFVVVTLNEDLKLECEITSYRVDYSGANSGERAQQYKLTIGVKAVFYDYQAEDEKDQKVTKTISNFDFFSPDQTLSDVEDELIQSISEKIILDMFNETTTKTEW